MRFYRDLEEWYEWAASAETCKFPDKENKMQVIRMITRLLFIWFLKEKNLVPSDLFDEEGTRAYLKDFDFETSELLPSYPAKSVLCNTQYTNSLNALSVNLMTPMILTHQQPNNPLRPSR